MQAIGEGSARDSAGIDHKNNQLEVILVAENVRSSLISDLD